MTPSAAEVAGAVARLRFELERRDFAEAEEAEGGMGGHHLVLVGKAGTPPGSVTVDLSGDRGHYALQISAGSMTRLIDSRVWQAWLDASPISSPDIVSQVAFVVGRLDELADAANADEEIEGRLVRLGENHMRRLLGMDAED